MAQLEKISQDELKYVYESAQARMDHNPDIASKYKKMIEGHAFCESEEDAMRIARKMENDERSGCQIWGKIGIDEEFYYIEDCYIVTNDIHICVAAEYIGMAQMYIA